SAAVLNFAAQPRCSISQLSRGAQFRSSAAVLLDSWPTERVLQFAVAALSRGPKSLLFPMFADRF
ncbi:MAG: hypothetical protein ACXWEI_23430, partial [Mycobacterium sp.]